MIIFIILFVILISGISRRGYYGYYGRPMYYRPLRRRPMFGFRPMGHEPRPMGHHGPMNGRRFR